MIPARRPDPTTPSQRHGLVRETRTPEAVDDAARIQACITRFGAVREDIVGMRLVVSYLRATEYARTPCALPLCPHPAVAGAVHCLTHAELMR